MQGRPTAHTEPDGAADAGDPPGVGQLASGLLANARADPGAALLILATGAAVLFAYAPVMAWLWDSWISNPYYGHGLLVFPIALWVAWRERGAFLAEARETHDLDYAWLFMAGVLFVVARFTGSNHLQAWSLLPLAIGLVLTTHGRARGEHMAWPFVLVALTLPIPFLEGFFGPMQLIATSGSARLANLAGLGVSWDAVSLTVDGITFAVVPLCAGLSSTLSLISVAAISYVLWPASMLARLLTFLFVIPLALMANMVRITGTVFIASRSGADAALGFFHGPGAIVLYLFALIGLGGLVWAMRKLDPLLAGLPLGPGSPPGGGLRA